MTPPSKQQADTETKISLIENDMTHMVAMFDKLETTLAKLTDLHNDMNKIMSVHEDRLNRGDAIDQEIVGELKSLRKESNEQHNELYQKVIDVEKVRWMIIGGGIALTYILSTLEIFK